MERPIRIAVLGAGGLGKAAARIIGMKREARLVAICDSRGLIASDEGLSGESMAGFAGGDLVECYRAACAGGAAGRARQGGGEDGGGVAVATDIEARHCEDPIGEILAMRERLDAVLVALPNMPNETIPNVIRRFAEAGASLVFVDVLKRTTAVKLMYELNPLVKRSKSVVMTGCGATPGFLAAAAVLAAQSFIEVEKVDIWWGVGIANWEAYRATIREDIAHLPGYTVERARAMSDADIDALLDRTHGLLELSCMEHADDLLLQRAGVVDRLEQVEVGGVMDTRHARKPVSTTMTLTGITIDGTRASHTFTLGDETTMAANVIGPALGYLKRGLWLKAHGHVGVFGSTECLPMVLR